MASITAMSGPRTRKCDTTGLPVCLDAEFFVKMNAVSAVVFLLLGGIAALTLALTRWPAVHLLDSTWFYRMLTFHGVNMLIFWILFMEMAILYFAGTTLLKTKLFSPKLAWAGFGLMISGAVMTDYIILMGQADVMLTSYLPLVAHPLFYLGIILFAVGALVNIFNFFATVYVAWKNKTYGETMPLVAFGAVTAAIIAVVALLHGAVALVPTLTFAMGWTAEPDPMWYRLIWWGLGHQSQQVNVVAMVSVWYLMSHLTSGGVVLNEFVSRGAFVLYILFINLASAHHLLVDPGVGATWKIWNTSYAMYLAVLASLIHGFTVPAGLEAGMRLKGYTKGLFGWLWNAPWKNPGFSGFFLSLVIFGFIGGITGVTLGTQQINITAHNTLRIPGHFHATVVGGTSLAFMGLTYYVVPLLFRREYSFKWLARLQPYVFAVGIVLMSLGMSFAGSAGVARRTWDIDAAGIYGATSHLMLGVLGIGGTLAFIGLLIYVLLTVHAVLFGQKNHGRAMDDWGTPKDIAPAEGDTEARELLEHGKAPGTMVLVLVLLACFVVYYFANWKALADLWHVR
ncbi:cbb3-type cytochrome c oxidase subunit I [Persicimonas caeni]|nr:cbb3-type cytochrome c oxidase subunit I [Persicimonas caeni]